MDRRARLVAIRMQDSRQAVTGLQVQISAVRRDIEAHAGALEKVDRLERFADDDLGHRPAAE